MSAAEVPPAHRKRPDPDEPWRYVCGDCGSPCVRTLKSPERRPPGKKYPANAMGPILAARQAMYKYRCRQCAERKTHLVDQTTGEEARP